MSRSRNVVWIVGGTLIGLFLLCGGMVTLAVVLFQKASQSPENVRIVVAVPEEVGMGAEVPIVVQITNLADKPQRLMCIDVYDTYLDGIELEASTPAWTKDEWSLGFRSYYYRKDIPPGETLNIALKGRAREIGTFEGDIDVCINTELSFETTVAHTRVHSELPSEDSVPPEDPSDTATEIDIEPADTIPGKKPLPDSADDETDEGSRR